jgi:hypothetical protein
MFVPATKSSGGTVVVPAGSGDVKTVLVIAGKVIIESLAVLGAVRVTEPPPVDLIDKGITQSSKLIR